MDETKNKPVNAKTIMTNPIHLLAFGLGSGLSPIAPGTMGTLASIPIYWLFKDIGLFPYLGITIFVCLVGILICDYSSKKLKVHDHPGIVWDEFAGFFITMLSIPFSVENLVIGFVLFRVFDILKPWPIKWVDQQVSGGFGIMLDDILAGLCALGSFHLILYFAASVNQ